MKPLLSTLSKIIVSLILILIVLPASYSQNRTADSTALVAIYNNLNGVGWINSSGWPDTGPINTWYGITFSGNRVVKVELQANGLNGQIPIEIGNLDMATTIDLSGNSIASTIPIEIGNAVSLDSLRLNNNSLFGPLPSEIGSLTNLIYLDVSFNNLNDSIPDTITSLTSLVELNLATNQFDYIPDLTVIGSLTVLDISENDFEFDDILPLIGISSFTYSPQNAFGVSLDTAVVLGDDFSLQQTSPGAGNAYQWLKESVDIPGEITEQLQIFSFALADTGVYNLTVTNSSAPGLTLTSRNINVFQEDTSYFKVVPVSAFVGESANLGAGWGDVNNDGFDDLIPTGSTGLYLNNGDGTFSVGVGDLVTNGGGFGPTSGDIDNDGDIDVFVANSSNPRLLINDGTGNMSLSGGGDLSALTGDFQDYAFADYDNDGFIDLFITAGANVVSEVNYLMRNNGDGTFSTISVGPVATDIEGSVSASWSDYDHDGDQDLYVMTQNSPNPNSLYQNNGDGTFTKVVTNELINDTFGAFGNSWGDYNNDGFLDVFVINNFNDPVLFENNGAGDFTRVVGAITLGDPFGSAWGDIDNDGLLDLLVSSFSNKNFLYLNNGDGTFTEITEGSFLTSQGFAPIALVDFNNDGNLDFVNRRGDWVLYENTQEGNNYLQVDLEGTISNRSGIGAKVRVKADIGGQPTWQLREISAGTGLFSQNSLTAHFGMGDATIADTVIVEWPSGIFQEMINVGLNQLHNVIEPDFVNVSDSLALVAIYDSLGGGNWNDSTNWKLGPVNTWFGVEVIGDRVVGLKLPSNNLSGQLPPAIGDLTAMTVLDLNGNFGVNGVLPLEIGNAIALDSLILDNLNLQDTIPIEIGDLPNLIYLSLNGNSIVAIPPEITNLSTLDYLDLANNRLENIPDLTGFSGLSFLDLVGNNLTFEDLDINSGIPGISYSPQDPVGADSLAALAIGESGTLFTQIQNYNGNNSYQWYKDSSPIPGETGPTLTAPSWTVADEGVYYLEATNPAVPGLTLTSNNFTIFTKEQSQFTWIEVSEFVDDGLLSATSYGAAVGDYDNDGLDDIWTINLGDIPSYLYRNLGGGTFERTTAAIPNGADHGTYGSAWGDYNNDGFLDLFACDVLFTSTNTDGIASIYRNNGDGTFTSISLDEPVYGAAWGDVNNDGLLDAAANVNGDSLHIYMNVGTDTLFKQAGIIDLSANGGIVSPFLVDLNGDSYVDLYLTGTPNQLFFNDGAGNFIEQPTNAIVTTTFSGPWGASFEDLDNDGDIDAFVRSYLNGQDSYIFINDGVGNFTGTSCFDLFGEACDRGRASALADMNNDGYVDIIFNEGQGTDTLEIYFNNANAGYSQLTGQNFLGTFPAHGISVFDYDNDGNLDIYSPSSFNFRANMLYQNQGIGNNWLKVKLEGTVSNRAGIGAEVSVYAGGLRNSRSAITNSGLHAGASNYLHFGMGANSQADSIVVKWPSGLVNRINNIAVNQTINILEELKDPVVTLDSSALVALYNATDGDNWFNNTNWLQPGQFVQDWYGITVENNRVTRIELYSNNLIGAIPVEIGDLTALKYLNLGDEINGGNGLEGNIPVEIGNLDSLEFLGLASNNFMGPIPDAIGNLSQLRKIDFAFNQLEDPVPDTISTLSNLSYLGIAFNTFTDVPLSIYTLPALDTLLLSGNQITGPIPPEIGSMSTLKFLNIGGNQYEGQLPPEFGNLTQLQGIRIWDMPGITGNIPPEWAALTAIEEFSLDNLSLSGTIPDFVGDYTNAFYISLSLNQFSGAVPSTFTNLTADVNLFGNALSSVPTLSNLSSLDVRKNRLLYEDLVPNDSISVQDIAEQNARYSVNVSGIVTAGGTATLTVTNSILGDAEYQWVKDGELLSGENAISLVLTNLDNSHVGVYTCLIQRPGGNGSYEGIPSESVSIDINETSRRYATAVDTVTSEARSIDYQAIEILGLPNRGFDDNDDPNDQIVRLNAEERGWTPALGDDNPYIEVSFDNPAPINSIWLFGSAPVSIEVFNPNSGEFESFLNFTRNGNNGEEIEVNFPTTTFNVSQLRINSFASVNSDFGPYNSIDAIAIGDNGIEINTPTDLFFELVTDTVINIGWSQLNFNDSTNFIIERSIDGTNFSEIATVETFTRYSDRQAPNIDSVYYRIAAQSGVLTSAYSEVLVAAKCDGLELIKEGSYTGIATELQPGFDTDGGFDANVLFTANPDGTITIEDFQAGYLDNFGSTPVIGTIFQNCDGTINVEGETALACGGDGITSINYAEFFPANDSLVIEYTYDCGYDVRLTYVKNLLDPIPNAPYNLTANVASNSSVHLSWSENSKFLEEWVIERSDDDSTYTEIATALPNRQAEIEGDLEIEAYVDNTVVSGNTYYYRVRARNASGDSDPSETFMVTVNDPHFNQILTGDIYNDIPSNSYHGSFGDYDSDGDQDLYVTNWHLFDDPAIVTKNNYLYQNDGSGVFTKVTSGDLVALEFGSRGALWADFDNDDDLDIFVNGQGTSQFIDDAKSFLFDNTGGGSFATNDQFESIGLGINNADFDNDGFLDIITSNNVIFINNGDGSYDEQTNPDHRSDGQDIPFGWTYLTPDLNQDLLPDLIVTGDGFFHIYENIGGFKFDLMYEDNDAPLSRGATFADFDGNGYLDVVIAGQNQPSRLVLFDASGILNELTPAEFLDTNVNTLRGLTNLDFDNDGDKDLIWIMDGGVPVLHENAGDGTFNRVNPLESSNFTMVSPFSHLSVADVNNDGFQDIFVASQINTQANNLYINNGNSNNYLRVNLEGDEVNKVGIGTQVRAKAGGTWRIEQVNNMNGLFNGNEITAHFGLAAATVVDSLEIRWTSGNVNRFANIPANQTITIVEDVTPPVVAVDVLGTSISSPEITGTIDDLAATLELTISDSTYLVTIINADSTWSLPAGTISPTLADGVYDVMAVATDQNENEGVDDIEGELTITQELRALVSSKRTSSSFQANWSEALDVQEYLLDVSEEADFSTFLTGYEDFSTTQRKALITDLDFNTTYYYRVRFVNTASETSDYSNDTTAVTRIKPETVSDFNALEAIYNATDGENWTNDGGWTTEPRLQNWEFITLENQRVTEIRVPSNNLSGTFPLRDSLTEVSVIDLSDNALTGIDSLTYLESLTELDVSANLLEFDDLEPQRSIANFSYSDQKTRISFNETAIADSLLVRVFSDTSLTFNVGGEFNTYQWFRNGTLITSGADFDVNEDSLGILSIDYSNMGKFKAEARNDSLPDLTIAVDSMFAFAVADFSVDVNDDNGELIPDNVDGYLLLTTQVNRGFDTLAVASNQPSAFTFNDVILGDYLISIDSDPEKYIPTYYADAFEWVEADTVLFREDTAFQVSMTLIPGELDPNDVGTLEVLIEEDFGDENARIDARRRAAKRKCGLRRKRSGGRTGQDDDEFELIAYGETDENGEFKFGFLPEGLYRFFVEYPGIPLDESSFVEFEIGEEGISDTDFKLTAFATEDGIEVNIERVLGLIFKYFKNLEVYPNPTTDVLKLSYRHLTDKKVGAQLVDLAGNVLWTQDIRSGYDGYEEIDVSGYKEGVYILHIFDKEDRESHVVSYRIMVR
ncbi:FG-GAP-like repeat-containing protein [Ekhidna sp.]|uniref:FG-GAP-like repeat-containing protein n=1 Tax=Ekhidna sp. TaxID=2608089 RepID=UPI003B515049